MKGVRRFDFDSKMSQPNGYRPRDEVTANQSNLDKEPKGRAVRPQHGSWENDIVYECQTSEQNGFEGGDGQQASLGEAGQCSPYPATATISRDGVPEREAEGDRYEVVAEVTGPQRLASKSDARGEDSHLTDDDAESAVGAT